MKCHNFFLFPSPGLSLLCWSSKNDSFKVEDDDKCCYWALGWGGEERVRRTFQKSEKPTRRSGGFTTKPHSPIKLSSVGWQSSVISYNKLCPVSVNSSHIVVCGKRLFHHNFLPLLADSSFAFLISFIEQRGENKTNASSFIRLWMAGDVWKIDAIE